MKRRKIKPVWERGYRSHGYWVGKHRAGVVKLQAAAAPEAKYLWEAAMSTGHAATLRDAKRAVEACVLKGQRQLPLFAE